MDPSRRTSPIQPDPGLRTLVATLGFGYDWSLMERWLLPLRRHYTGNVTVVVQSSDISRQNLGLLAAMHQVDLLASPNNVSRRNLVGSRWRDLSTACDSRYDVCLITDMRDVYWQAPPFAALEDWYVKPGRRIPDLLLTTEHTGVNMLDCKFSRNRVQECYGSDGLKQAFAGHVALPPPDPWWKVLGVAPDASLTEIEAAFRALAKQAHADTGGSDEAMIRLNLARDEARKARG